MKKQCRKLFSDFIANQNTAKNLIISTLATIILFTIVEWNFDNNFQAVFTVAFFAFLFAAMLEHLDELMLNRIESKIRRMMRENKKEENEYAEENSLKEAI